MLGVILLKLEQSDHKFNHSLLAVPRFALWPIIGLAGELYAQGVEKPVKYSYFSPFDLIGLALPLGPATYSAKVTSIRDYFLGVRADPGIEAGVEAAKQWLCDAQDQTTTADGGVARHFSLIDGWGPSYPETTGYIVPTLLECARVTSDRSLLNRSRKMLDWLVSIQNSDGSFNGGTIAASPQVPVLFNTGQILIGLAAGAAGLDDRFREPMVRAADWMVQAQDSDGCWRRFASPFAISGERTYDTHAALGLLAAAEVATRQEYADAAIRNVNWAIGKQRKNGWFEDCCITDVDRPLTHTIGYTIRGILGAFEFSRDPRQLDAAALALDSLLHGQRPDGGLPGRFDQAWQSCARWTCLTGNLQIAECWLILYEQTGNSDYLAAAKKANRFVRCRIRTESVPGRNGGISGAYPISGNYTPFEYPNWAAKFFIDANLAEQRNLDGSG